MSRLHELAQRLGVETHWPSLAITHDALPTTMVTGEIARQDKDIAHDMLVKLPQFDYNVWWRGQRWTAWCDDLPDALYAGTFEEAVCALAERHLENKP